MPYPAPVLPCDLLSTRGENSPASLTGISVLPGESSGQGSEGAMGTFGVGIQFRTGVVLAVDDRISWPNQAAVRDHTVKWLIHPETPIAIVWSGLEMIAQRFAAAFPTATFDGPLTQRLKQIARLGVDACHEGRYQVPIPQADFHLLVGLLDDQGVPVVYRTGTGLGWYADGPSTWAWIGSSPNAEAFLQRIARPGLSEEGAIQLAVGVLWETHQVNSTVGMHPTVLVMKGESLTVVPTETIAHLQTAWEAVNQAAWQWWRRYLD